MADLVAPAQSETLATEPRSPVEAPKADPSNDDLLRQEWRKMTDAHQSLRLVAKLKANWLGACRIVGALLALPLAPESVNAALEAMAAGMLFMGKRACIQIHSRTRHALQPMGPAQNVMDPGFNLHLRSDHIAEVRAVEKPAARSPALGRGLRCRGRSDPPGLRLPQGG